MSIDRLIYAPLWLAPFLLGLILMAAPVVFWPTGPAAAQSAPQLPANLRSLRKRMNAGEELSMRQLRQLADAADGMAAFNFAKRLEETGDPELLPDAIHYYAIASYTDRDFAVKRLAVLLMAVPLSPGRLRNALDALTRQAQTGNADAALALSQMYETGTPFGRNPAAMRRWLEQAAVAGNAQAMLKLALLRMMPTDDTAPDYTGARDMLMLLAAHDDPGLKAAAATLLIRLDGMESPNQGVLK